MISAHQFSLHSFILGRDLRPQTACVRVVVCLLVTLFNRRSAYGSTIGRLQTPTESSLALHIPKLLLIHAEVVPQFVYERHADLFADFCLGRTDGFDVLLIKHNVGKTHWNIKNALLCRWHAVKDA